MRDLVPFLKWVGGKRWMTWRHDWLFPSEYKCYFEPFLGGGAVLMHLQPRKAVIADLNVDLIEAYKAVKRDWRQIERLLAKHQRLHSHDYYYRIRATHFSERTEEAARFIYLNRACFNGIYRVNLKGEFNVPKGSKDAIVLDDDDFGSISQVLRKCQIVAQDFEETIAMAGRGDFVFVDPPYTVKHNNNGFIKYNQDLFAWADQVRLRDCIKDAVYRGAYVLLTNANHSSVRDLYRNLGAMHQLDRASILSASSLHRRLSSELAITIGYSAMEPSSAAISRVRAAQAVR
ncbi:Dam family site-specific DNA-(adenine-N6)-methyltransferase [Bradyrhizobium sp. Tv2a-2]|uniref:DNA adenine methylase n=1 Tax=Bradyrhizobium sp. Tv2a-2 TaxID=113395 RepID=UPI000465FD3F|nr:Dam family site-specific DNA-(adenine-N6)-methyltransferase [Bradyrhizobium sp. Tv2a-2]